MSTSQPPEPLAPGAPASPELVEAARRRLLDQVANASPQELAAMLTAQGAAGNGGATSAGPAPAPAPAAVEDDYRRLGLSDELPEAATATGPRTPLWRHTAFRYLALALAAALVVVGVYSLGDRGASGSAGASASASSSQVPVSTPKPADPKMVAALEGKIKANPKDTLSMKALGEVYSQAEEYQKAAAWQQRVTQVDPKDVDAWLALGVAQFNGADLTGAEKAWSRAAQLEPRRAETFYNLGFLYYSKGDTVKARQMWQKVVDIDPKSQLAQTVGSHLTAASASPTAVASR